MSVTGKESAACVTLDLLQRVKSIRVTPWDATRLQGKDTRVSLHTVQ